MKTLLFLLAFLPLACSTDPVEEPQTLVEYEYGIFLMETCPTNRNHTLHDVTESEFNEVLDYLQTTNEECVTVEFYSMTSNKTVSGWFGGVVKPID